MSEEPAVDSMPAPKFKPVTLNQRVQSVDIMRGCALLGILLMNIWAFALPDAGLFNPLVAGGTGTADMWTYHICYTVFFQKIMALFSMLFGAGLALMAIRADERGIVFGKTYYKRIFWLFAIGMIHAYFLWYGDILVAYALCGLLLYPLRKLRPSRLIILGTACLIIGALLWSGMGFMLGYMRDTADGAQAKIKAGEEITELEESMLESWKETRIGFHPTEEQLEEQLQIYRGSYSDNFNYRIMKNIWMQTFGFLTMFAWRIMGLMLIGMALLKLGIFSGERSKGFYAILMAIGYPIGLPLSGYAVYLLYDHSYDAVYYFKFAGTLDYLVGLFVVMGHVGLIMYICKSNILNKLKSALAAVGRMALTNYLLHTIALTTIFYGYGLALFGHVGRFALLGFVIGMWIFQLIISPAWFSKFRYGPAEWLWRFLTYGKLEKMSLK